ncbi:Ferric uptake regulation protein [Nymphon striatum]|nr:Ferric uptake regulation protein [Nymphon striatum]
MADIHATTFKPAWTDGEFADLLNNDNIGGIALVEQASNGGAMVGFALIREAADEAEVLTIAVKPNWQKQGVGRRLMDIALSNLDLNGIETLFLEVDSNNKNATALYQRIGFEQVAIRKNYYSLEDGVKSNALVMRHKVSENSDKSLEELIADRGMRMTDQRRIIARVIESADDHPDVEELYRRSSSIDANISISTVYRTVRLFEDLNMIEKHEFRDGRARYEAIPEEHHDHLIDLRSGQVIEFKNERIEALQEEIARELGYKLIDHRLELYAIPIKNTDKESSN